MIYYLITHLAHLKLLLGGTVVRVDATESAAAAALSPCLSPLSFAALPLAVTVALNPRCPH